MSNSSKYSKEIEEILSKVNYKYTFGVKMYFKDDVLKALQEAFDLALSEKEEESKCISVDNELPKLGDEYEVAYDLKDGDHPLTTSMDYDAIKKIWTDPRGTGQAEKCVLFWKEHTEPPKLIFKNNKWVLPTKRK